ncbi:MAG: Ig-like domain-containing protein [Dysgonamonadaceae bacterium]|nr:Ig-like domain-containing protein [Dysgonamonadaceae bacterium]
MKHKILLLVLTVFFMVVANVWNVSAGVVTNAADAGTGSLRQAVIDAEAGDEITFDESLSGATITLESAIQIDKNITIIGSGQKLVPADKGYPAIYIPDNGGNAEPVVSISRFWFDGFSNKDVRSGRGGAISSGKSGTLKVYSCIFTGNSSDGEGMVISKIWNPNGTIYRDRFYIYGCTFYDNAEGDAIFLHEEPPVAAGNVFFINGEGSKAIISPLVTPDDYVKYNAYNTTLVTGDIGYTNLKIFDYPLDRNFAPTSDEVKILPDDLSDLPDDYPSVDFYGREIKAGGYAGAVQFVCIEDGIVVECEEIAVKGISLSDAEYDIYREYTTVGLTPIFDPLDATNKKVTWSSSDEDVAVVDSRGVVSGKKVGSAVITVTTDDGGFKASATVNVLEPDPCVYRYDRTNWTAEYGSGAPGEHGRQNTPTIMFDDNYLDEGQGWHNGSTSGENYIREAVVVDMGEVLSVGKIVLYQTGNMSDIVVYLPSEEVPAAHDTNDPGKGYSYPVGTWNCPETDAEIAAGMQTYGKGSGVNLAYRVEIDIEGDRSSRYVIVALLNTRGGGEFEYKSSYCNIVEFEVYPPCTPQVTSWEIGAGAAANVIASIEGEILYIRGEGAMIDFPGFINEYGYTGSGAPWMVNIEYDEDNAIQSITKNPISTAITEIIIEEGVTNIGANFAWDNDGDVLPDVTRLTISEGVTGIGSRAFNGVPLEGNLVIPEGVVTIGDYAFDDNGRGSVTSLTLPSTFAPEAGVHHLFDNLALTDISIAAETPPVFSGSEAIFTPDTYEKAKLHIPYGTKTAYEAAAIWKDFDNIVEEAGKIPVVELPYISGDSEFADDILPFLTGSYADERNDGVVAVSFTVYKAGVLDIRCIGYTIYLFDDESVDGDELFKAGNGVFNRDIEAGTYYLVVDDLIPVGPADTEPALDLEGKYNLSIVFKDGAGIGTTAKTVKSVTYYDLLGRTVNSDSKGIIIKQITYDDGSIVTEKTYAPNK